MFCVFGRPVASCTRLRAVFGSPTPRNTGQNGPSPFSAQGSSAQKVWAQDCQLEASLCHGCRIQTHVDSRTGRPVRRTQSYSSSPMEQMLKRIVAREETSHDENSSVSARPEALRLRQQLRKCKLKCELANSITVDDALSMIDALQKKQASCSCEILELVAFLSFSYLALTVCCMLVLYCLAY
eukprot:58671-Pleurochrysis_carterae.AAC.8